MKKILIIILLLNFYSIEQLQAQLLGGRLMSKPRPSVFHLGTAVIEVTSPTTGRIWMDRNLGAQRAAISYDDQAAVGDMYQWGRWADGHEKITSGTTNTQSSTDTPGNGNFILNSDWRNPQNLNLWQGVNGINNPCPNGFRLPTKEEWNAEVLGFYTNVTQTLPPSPGFVRRVTYGLAPFESFLKIPSTGIRQEWGTYGFNVLMGNYWTSTIDGTRRFPGDTPRAPFFPIGYVILFDPERDDTSYEDGKQQQTYSFGGVTGKGLAVRCIKN